MQYRDRNILYLSLGLASFVGFIWLLIADYYSSHEQVILWPGCLMQLTLNIPCPSCGSTRSALAFLSGSPLEGLHLNPLGILLLPAMTLIPVWIIYDLLSGKATLANLLKHNLEVLKKNRIIVILLLCLFLSNWIWNIIKGL